MSQANNISKIKVKGTSYNVVDTFAREQIQTLKTNNSSSEQRLDNIEQQLIELDNELSEI